MLLVETVRARPRGGPHLTGHAQRADVGGRNTPEWKTLALLIGERIRAVRESKNIAPSELEAAIGCSKSIVRQWERGEKTTSLGTLVAISRALNCALGDLIPHEIRNVVVVKTTAAEEISKRRRTAEILLARAGGSVKEAAKLAGVNANTMSHRLKRLGVQVDKKPGRRDKRGRWLTK